VQRDVKQVARPHDDRNALEAQWGGDLRGWRSNDTRRGKEQARDDGHRFPLSADECSAAARSLLVALFIFFYARRPEWRHASRELDEERTRPRDPDPDRRPRLPPVRRFLRRDAGGRGACGAHPRRPFDGSSKVTTFETAFDVLRDGDAVSFPHYYARAATGSFAPSSGSCDGATSRGSD